MIVSTTRSIAGKRIVRTLGLVRGNTVRARLLGRDITATLRNLVGGEVSEYTKMMAEAREQALDRMVEEAEELGANAVIGTRFMTSMLMQGAAELLAYGTAVIVEDEVLLVGGEGVLEGLPGEGPRDLGGLEAGRQVVGMDGPPLAHQHRALDAVLQLADIARPVVAHEQVDGARRDPARHALPCLRSPSGLGSAPA